MNYNIAVEDIVKMAVKIEENGEMAYRQLAKQFADQEIREVFKTLAEQETYHRSYFEGLLSSLLKAAPSQRLEPDKLEYLKGFAGKHVFLPENILSLMSEKLKSIIEVLEFAILAEKESVEFYEKLINLVPETEKLEVEKIIGQERNHFQILTKEKEKILNSGEK